jgi:hypothetical protein
MGGGVPSLDGVGRAVKIIPSESVHVRAENEIGVPLPYFELMFLSGADGPANNLEKIRRGAVVDILNPDGDCQNAAGSQLTSGLRGNGSDQAAVSEPARADLNGFEQAGESATSADGFNQVAVGENDRFAIA